MFLRHLTIFIYLNLSGSWVNAFTQLFLHKLFGSRELITSTVDVVIIAICPHCVFIRVPFDICMNFNLQIILQIALNLFMSPINFGQKFITILRYTDTLIWIFLSDVGSWLNTCRTTSNNQDWFCFANIFSYCGTL